ncbi:ZnMc domain-containing protein [Aphelenchoides bicaudatus]|nr:ZnMc domain-containing protein [Aphelenchoides bicaudatus]
MITRPRLIREYWPELLTWPVDAALEMNGQVFMFVGNQVLTFQNRRLMSTKNLTELGLPSDLTKVRLAYKWFYGDVMHFVWNETHYWKLDARTMKTEVDYPRLISNIWKGIPTTVSAAFSWSNELWFVDAGVMFKFDSFKMDVSRGYPRRFSHILDHCLPRAEA